MEEFIMTTPNAELTLAARNHLKGNWGPAITTTVVYALICVLISVIPHVGWMISVAISGPLAIGFCKFFLLLTNNTVPKLEILFDGFKDFFNAFITYILVMVFTILWTLLLIVPGILAALSYSMTFFILAENSEIDAMEAITKSKQLMIGNKWKLACLFFRFFGWFLLGTLTLGIGFIWIVPYYTTSYALFYKDISGQPVKVEPTYS
jgi:uncharacterized membrane protein